MELRARIVSVLETGTQRMITCESGGHYRVARAGDGADMSVLRAAADAKSEALLAVEGGTIVRAQALTAGKEPETAKTAAETAGSRAIGSMGDVAEFFLDCVERHGGREREELAGLLAACRTEAGCCDVTELRAAAAAYQAGLARCRQLNRDMPGTDGQRAAYGAYALLSERGYPAMLQGRVFGMLMTVSSVGTPLTPTPEALCLREALDELKGGQEDV